jgi:hypothetical protein
VKATSQEGGAGVDAEADVDGEAIFEKPKRGARSKDRAGRTGRSLQAGDNEFPVSRSQDRKIRRGPKRVRKNIKPFNPTRPGKANDLEKTDSWSSVWKP